MEMNIRCIQSTCSAAIDIEACKELACRRILDQTVTEIFLELTRSHKFVQSILKLSLVVLKMKLKPMASQYAWGATVAVLHRIEPFD
jgi:hypothetical protein